MTVKIVTQEQQKKITLNQYLNHFVMYKGFISEVSSSPISFQTCYFIQLNPDPGKISLILIHSD